MGTGVPALYRFHVSLHIPEFWGINRWGEWLLGGVAILWTIDCFFSFYLTTPLRHAPNTGRPADVERALRRGWWARWKPAEALEIGRAEAVRRGWDLSVGHVFYTRRRGFYGVRFLEGDGHGAAGVGPPVIFVYGNDGAVIGDRIPWKGTVADIFIQAQFPLHSGRILGMPGRILISVMGLVVADRKSVV